MSTLFSPYALGPLALKNRIVIAPMCQYSAVDGAATDWHLIHLGHLALSGAGLLIIEATAVEAHRAHHAGLPGPVVRRHRGRAAARAAGRARAFAHAHRHPARPCRAQGLEPCALGGRPADRARAGRLAAGGAVGAAAAERRGAAAGAGRAGLQRIVAAFVDAARRAHRLGLDAIELHAAHGYLLHQFLSPISNARTDAYGGSLDNRMRFPLQVFDAVRAAVPAAMPVGVRLSATDWVEGGWDVAQSLAFAQRAADRAGWASCMCPAAACRRSRRSRSAPATRWGWPKRCGARPALPTIAVGLITEAEQAEAIVASGQADLVALARGMLFDPRWPWHAAAQLGAHGGGAAAVLALAAARHERAVRRRAHRHALKERA